VNHFLYDVMSSILILMLLNLSQTVNSVKIGRRHPRKYQANYKRNPPLPDISRA
jgi:hypothetical protein